MYRVIQTRTVRGSDQNDSNVVWTGSRIREARGECKMNINSTEEMLINHEFPFLDGDVDLENFELTLSDDEGIWYRIKYSIEEFEDSE